MWDWLYLTSLHAGQSMTSKYMEWVLHTLLASLHPFRFKSVINRPDLPVILRCASLVPVYRVT